MSLLACVPSHAPGFHRARPDSPAVDSVEDSVVDSADTDSAPDETDSPVDTSGPCPSGMALVEDVCMDLYEAPNVQGELPLVMYTWQESGEWCAARGKRLCTDDEWLTACEGGEGREYPYHGAYDAGRCNDEETWLVYSQDALNQWPPSASSTEVESLDQLYARAGSAAGEVQDLYQGEGGGANSGCVNHYGVYDLVGNVEEWTTRADGGTTSFHGNLKGRYWAESRTCQSNVTVHGDTFRFYEIGFRCCSEPE